MENPDFLQNELFSSLTIREKEILKNNSAVLDFEEEEMLFKNGSFCSSVYFVGEGSIRLRKTDHNLFFILEKGDVLGLDSVFNEDPVYFSAYDAGESRIVQIGANVVRNFISSNSLFLSAVGRKNNESNRKLISSLLEYRDRKINGAFATFLLRYDGHPCIDDLTRKEIGEIIGYSRENVTKVIRNLISEGVVEENRRHLRIVDRKKLEILKNKG